MLISITHANSINQRSSDFLLRDSILDFLEEYHFDGIELDWPAAAKDWSAFKTKLKLIGVPLIKKGYILAVALGPDDPLDPELTLIVDLITLKSWRDFPTCRNYDDCEETEQFARHPGPLSFIARNVSKRIDRIDAEQRSKIVLGLPIFGQGYTLKFSNLTDTGAPVLGPGKEGVYTKRQDGRLAYYEVRHYFVLIKPKVF